MGLDEFTLDWNEPRRPRRGFCSPSWSSCLIERFRELGNPIKAANLIREEVPIEDDHFDTEDDDIPYFQGGLGIIWD